MDKADKIVAGITGFLVTLCVGLVSYSAYAEACCLEHGFPSSSFTWTGKIFCTNHEVAVSLKALQK